MASRSASTRRRASRPAPSTSEPPFAVLRGDCVEMMRTLDAGSVDAVVTDPPYGINFMGKAWDGRQIARDVQADRDTRVLPPGRTGSGFGHPSSIAGAYDFSPHGMLAFQEWTRLWAVEAHRVLKPGGYLLSFASARTYHRMTVGIEDAGFDIRDSIHWLFGSGFPKNMDVARAIDQHHGVERTVVGSANGPGRPGFAGDRFQDEPDRVYQGRGSLPAEYDVTVPTSDDAKRWAGWGTALKPAHEPVAMCRKPLDGTVAANVLAHGTGAINVDGSLVGTEAGTRAVHRPKGDSGGATAFPKTVIEPTEGRWPANMIVSHLDECEGQGATHTDVLCAPGCPVAELNDMSGVDAARFFYIPKAARRERVGGTMRNMHPTVKPVDLMRHLIRLVTPPGGLVLDPFLGSGSTGCAAMAEGMRFVGCEREPEYQEIAQARISDWAFAHNRLTAT